MRYLIFGTIIVDVVVTGSLLIREVFKIIDLLEYLILKGDSTMINKFHEACQNIVDNADQKALNYAVNYAKYGLELEELADVKVQALYILNNMTHWRGDLAKETRATLKEVAKACC